MKLFLAVAAIALNACALRGTGAPLDVVWPKMTEEFYRVEGVVCGVPEEVRDGRGVLLGLRFSLAKFGTSCREGCRDVFISIGKSRLMDRAGVLRVNDAIALVGTLGGWQQNTVVAVELFVHNR